MVNQTPNPQELYEWQKVKQPFQFGRVMNRSFSGLFKNIKPIMLVIALAIFISSAISAPMYLLNLSDPSAVMETSPYSILTGISSIVGFILIMSICVFTDHMAFASFTNKHTVFCYVLLRSLKLTIPVLFIVLLYFVSSYIGMIFLIVPGVIISVGWSVIGPVYLHEDTSLFGSFGRSWFLTRGYKWWVWLATVIMYFIAWIAFFTVVAIVSTVSMTSLSDPEMTLGFTPKQFLVGIIFNLCMYLAIALYASFTTALYTELRELKEGPLTEAMSAVFD